MVIPKIKIFALYYDRFKSATTSIELSKEKIHHTVLCHNNAEKFDCIGEYGNLIETGKPKGIGHNMNYALSQIQTDDWCIMVSDDYTRSYKLAGNKFSECSFGYIFEALFDIIKKMDSSGVKFIGLNVTGNPFYSKKKYSKYGLIDTRLCAIKKTPFEWDTEIQTIPDYYATAYHLKHYGGNLILNHCYADFERYKDGGLGSVKERMNQKIKDCRKVIQEFPDNIAYKDKVGHPKYSHIVVKRNAKR